MRLYSIEKSPCISRPTTVQTGVIQGSTNCTLQKYYPGPKQSKLFPISCFQILSHCSFALQEYYKPETQSQFFTGWENINVQSLLVKTIQLSRVAMVGLFSFNQHITFIFCNHDQPQPHDDSIHFAKLINCICDQSQIYVLTYVY